MEHPFNVEKLTDYELWDLLVGKEPAKHLVQYSIKELSQLGDVEIISIPGADNETFMTVRVFLELSKRLTTKPLTFDQKFQGSSEVALSYFSRLRYLGQEHLYALLLGNQNHLLKEVLVSIGSFDCNIIRPREIFSPAIREQASAIIITHNHPGGDQSPSDEDKRFTDHTQKAGELLGIKLLDHIIIGHDNYYSFADDGLL